MNFKESYTSDTNIMDQWTKDMIKKLEKDQNDGKFEIHCIEKPSGRCLVAVFNKNNFRTFRCIVAKYLLNYGIARCYAKATGGKVKTLVTPVPMDIAIKNKEFITRFRTPIYNENNEQVRIEMGKYRKYTGMEARITAYNLQDLDLTYHVNYEFFLPATDCFIDLD